MMLATGLRIGETAAITWPAVDLDSGTVEVRGTVIRVRGEGLVIKPKPKSEAGWRSIELPSWCTAMLRRRTDRPANRWEAVFTSPTGLLRDPSNTQADLREVFARVGYPGVTSHTFRRTVGTLMDEAGLSARAAADQLGHAKVSMTQDRYFGRKLRATGARGGPGGGRANESQRKVWVKRGRDLESVRRLGLLTWGYAPPSGLEPLTLRLTVACSAN